jgi:hypothetical protein
MIIKKNDFFSFITLKVLKTNYSLYITYSPVDISCPKMSNIVAPETFAAENFTFTTPKKVNGKLRTLILYNNKMCYFMTPEVRAPFGVSAYDPNKDNDKAGNPEDMNYSFPITAVAKNADDNDVVANFFQQWRELDSRVIDFAVENSKILFGKSRDRNQVEAIYSSCVRVKEDGDQAYPPMISPKIQKVKENADKPNILVFRGKSREPLELETFQELVANVGKGSHVQLIIQPRIWIIPGKIGVTMSVIQAKVEKVSAGRPTKYAFGKTDDDEDAEGEDGGNDENAGEEGAEDAPAEAADSDAD